MMIIAGTVPVPGLPLTLGEVINEGDAIVIGERRIPCTQGTASMMSAALATTACLGLDPPHGLVAGDIGDGQGSRELYQYLIDNVGRLSPGVLALHYWLPDMRQTRDLCRAVDACSPRPVMIADAASMYSAKGAGLAGAFDVFTPDATEIAFLADPAATHPAFVARHLFETDVTRAPELARMAYRNHAAARLLLVKGAVDYVINDGGVLATVAEPDVPAMEAIGGTGDTITGLVAALIYGGLKPREAAVTAARANRVAGQSARATPATRVWQIIHELPAVLNEHPGPWSGVCLAKGDCHD